MKDEMILCTDWDTRSYGLIGCFPGENYFFGFREHLEANPRYRQICTYTLVKVEGKFLVYERSKKGSENRLRGLDSIGVGGHINILDASIRSGGAVDIRQTVIRGVVRELREELDMCLLPSIEFLGTIVLNETEVDKVHVGVVSLIRLQALPEKHEDALCNVRLQSPEELRANSNLETWSQTLLPYLERF